MNAIKSALLLGLALCVAATSGLARESGSHAKSSRSSSSKSHKASTKSRKAKARKAEARANRGSESERFLRGASDLPPEDLPEAENDDDADSQLR